LAIYIMIYIIYQGISWLMKLGRHTMFGHENGAPVTSHSTCSQWLKNHSVIWNAVSNPFDFYGLRTCSRWCKEPPGIYLQQIIPGSQDAIGGHIPPWSLGHEAKVWQLQRCADEANLR
jgi:hypothetical protein